MTASKNLTKTQTSKVRISFLIVNFNSRTVLEKCLDSLRAVIKDTSYEILIANNDDEPLTLVGSNITVHENETNIGFAAAHNTLAQKAVGESLCFLNPDTYDFPEDFLTLEKTLSDTVAIAAPLLQNPDGAPQAWSVGKTLTPFRLILNKLGLTQRLWEKDDVHFVDWVSGGVFFIKRTTFLSHSGFDTTYFLYFEDLDLCRRVRETDMNILWMPTITVTHESGSSSAEKGVQKNHYYTSQQYYFSKFYNDWIAKMITTLRKIVY